MVSQTEVHTELFCVAEVEKEKKNKQIKKKIYITSSRIEELTILIINGNIFDL